MSFEQRAWARAQRGVRLGDDQADARRQRRRRDPAAGYAERCQVLIHRLDARRQGAHMPGPDRAGLRLRSAVRPRAGAPAVPARNRALRRRRAAAAIAVARHAACATERMRRRGAGAARGGRAPGKAPGRFTPVLKMPLALPYQPYTYAPRAGLLLQPLHARRQRDRAGHGRQQEPAAVVPPGGRAAERGCVRAGAARPAGLVAGRGRHRRPAVRAPRCMHDVGCGLGRASLHIQLWRTRAW